MKLRVDSEITELNNLFLSVKSLPDDEIKSHLVKYLCVRSSGLVENVIKSLVGNFHSGTCKTETENYVVGKIARVTNLDDANLQRLLRVFNSKWGDTYVSERKDNHKSSLDSIVHNRNNIAHGKASVGLTYSQLEQYYKDLKEIVDILKKIVKR